MGALLTTIVVITCVVGYLATGIWLVARPYIPRAMEHKRRTYPSLASSRTEVAMWRREAAWEALFLGLVWPFYFVVRALGLAAIRLEASAPLTPYEVQHHQAHLQKELDRRNRRVAELERELGIGGGRQ